MSDNTAITQLAKANVALREQLTAARTALAEAEGEVERLNTLVSKMNSAINAKNTKIVDLKEVVMLCGRDEGISLEPCASSHTPSEIQATTATLRGMKMARKIYAAARQAAAAKAGGAK